MVADTHCAKKGKELGVIFTDTLMTCAREQYRGRIRKARTMVGSWLCGLAAEVHTLTDVAAVDTYDLADQLSSALEPTLHGELLEEQSPYSERRS